LDLRCSDWKSGSVQQHSFILVVVSSSSSSSQNNIVSIHFPALLLITTKKIGEEFLKAKCFVKFFLYRAMGIMDAIWPLKRPIHPNLAFLKQFARNKMIGQFGHLAFIWPFFIFEDLAF
jgi:hypothetical protein